MTFLNIFNSHFSLCPNIGKIRLKLGKNVFFSTLWVPGFLVYFPTEMHLTKTQTKACPRFFFSLFFLIICLWLCFWFSKSNFKIRQSIAIKNTKLLLKKRGHAFVRNELAQEKVDLSRFCSGACQVFTTQKPFLNEISQTGKLQHQISSNILSYRITICQSILKSIFLFASKLNIWILSGHFPFLVQFSIEMK